MKSFTDIDIAISYISYGNDSMVKKLLVPALEVSKLYKRSVGFFSSSSLKSLSKGLKKLVDNNGKIQIIASPKLSIEDIEVISKSYETKDMYIEKKISEQLLSSLDIIEEDEKILLANLILSGVMEIKIVVPKNYGMYHDKLGILQDFYNNRIVFVGSSNESYTGLEENYEKIRVFVSWSSDSQKAYVKDEENEFDKIWNSENQYMNTYTFNDALKSVAFEIIEKTTKGKSKKIELRDYQLEAIEKWKKNGYLGFYVMATGTGKTFTAIFGMKNLAMESEILPIIVVPYKHLVSQWSEDIRRIFPDAVLIQVASEFTDWEKNLKESLISLKYSEGNTQVIVITTLASFVLDRFTATLNRYKGKKLLIVDEAHRFYNKTLESDYKDYQYKLGLSATPVFGKNIEKSKKLLSFFGGKVFELTLQDAIGKHLVNYTYTPILITIPVEDEEKFKKISIQMRYCFDKDGKMIDPERFIELHRNRLRVLSMTQSKMDALHQLFTERNFIDHFIIYAGDGKVYKSQDLEIRHLDEIKLILNDYGYRPSQFTAKENMEDRVRLIELFARGEISSLVAIKCLDEGINIPSIKTAIILSSNDDYREFVQRRGRILRKDGLKQQSEIVDFIIKPSVDSVEIAKIELRRFMEYSKLALNSEHLDKQLNYLLNYYNINKSEIDFDEILTEIDGGELDE